VLATSWTGRRTVIRLGLLGTALLLLLTATIALSAESRSAAADRRGYGAESWVTSWSASPQRAIAGPLATAPRSPDRPRHHRHQRRRRSAPAELTNLYGASPLQIGHLTVAVADPGAAVLPGTMNPVTYRGRASFQIPAGAQIRSDPVAMRVWPLQELAVSIYLPGQTPVAATFHADAQQVNWVSAAGDHAADLDAGAFSTAVRPGITSAAGGAVTGRDRTVVAFGDSITDGVGSDDDANARWPNDLARRLDALGGPTLSVTDAGIGGNRVLASSPSFGASAEARFGRDALDQPGSGTSSCLRDQRHRAQHEQAAPGTAIGAAPIIAGYRS